jgi:hypothetical protein
MSLTPILTLSLCPSLSVSLSLSLSVCLPLSATDSLSLSLSHRGYWPNDERTLSSSPSLSVSRDMMLIPSSLFFQLHGFDPLTSPHLEDSDFCLRAHSLFNTTTLSSATAIGITLLSQYTTIDTTPEYTSTLFSPLKMSGNELEALREYSVRWREVERERKRKSYLTTAKLTWVIHCGGSQGLEAATILQTLYQ